MALKPTYVGKEAVMDAFDTFIEECPYWSFWEGKLMFTRSIKSDGDHGRERLEDMLTAREQSRNTNVFVVKFYTELAGTGLSEKNVDAIIVGKVIPEYQTDEGVSIGAAEIHNGVIPYRAYKGIYDKLQNDFIGAITPLVERMDAYEKKRQEMEAEPEPLTGWEKILNNPAIMGLIQQVAPQIIPAILPVVGKVVGSFIPKQNFANMPISGVPNEAPQKPETMSAETIIKQWDDGITDEQAEQVNNALDRLNTRMNVLTDLTLLADYADKNPDMFKLLLMTLKSEQ